MRQGEGTDRKRHAAMGLLVIALALPLRDGRAAGADDQPIWTDRPVRIDRTTQDYERLPVARQPSPPLQIHIARNVTVLDGGSFAQHGHVYVLTGAVPVDARRLCRGENDHVAACGQQARFQLRKLIANRTLSCTEDYGTGSLFFVSCRSRDTDIAEALVGMGMAWAATPPLLTVQQQAMHRDLGIWKDSECRAAGRCPGRAKR